MENKKKFKFLWIKKTALVYLSYFHSFSRSFSRLSSSYFLCRMPNIKQMFDFLIIWIEDLSSKEKVFFYYLHIQNKRYVTEKLHKSINEFNFLKPLLIMLTSIIMWIEIKGLKTIMSFHPINLLMAKNVILKLIHNTRGF